MKKTFLLLLAFSVQAKVFSQFTIYNTSNSALSDNYGWFVTKDPGGKIWAATQGGGANVFNGTSWSNYKTSNSGIAGNSITPIIFESNGDAWFGTYQCSGGISKFNGTSWTTYNPINSGIPDYNIVAIVIDTNNNKWIGTRNHGLAKFNGTTWTIYNSSNSPLPSDVIYALEVDPAGNIWVGTALGGLAKFNGSNWTLYNTANSSLPNDDIYSLKYNTTTNTLWVGTYGGIALINGSNWTVYTSSNSGLSSNYVRGFSFVNSTGDTWIATGYNGICRKNASGWQTYNTSNSNIPVNGIWSICAVSPYQVWASTWGGGIVSLNTEVNTGIEKNKQEEMIVSVFPNPTKNKIYFTNLINSVSCSVTLYNNLGEKIKSQIFESPSLSFEMDTNELPAGIYHCIVSDGISEQTLKVIVQK